MRWLMAQSARAVDPVAGIAEAGQDVAVIVEPSSSAAVIDSDVRMGVRHPRHALRRRQQAGELDIGRPRPA